MISSFVVVAAHNRPDTLARCLENLSEAELVVCIDNASSPALSSDLLNVEIIQDDEQPPNLSRLWNLGLDRVASYAESRHLSSWNVAIINDDVVLPPRWLTDLGAALRQHDTAIAFGDQHGVVSSPMIHYDASPISLFCRIVGYAHVARGELGLRFDETLKWWYGDDDYDWQARLAGGSLLMPGFKVEHSDPDGHTSRSQELQVQAGHDRETFKEKWGVTPW